MFSYTICNNHRRFQERIERLGMNEKERGQYRELLAVFDLACNVANVSYFLWSGTLLGFREGQNVEQHTTKQDHDKK